MRGTLQQFRDKPGVKGVSSTVSHQPPQHGLADQGKIAEQVENFMSNELIGESKRCVVEHSRFGKDDRILQRSTTNQAARLQRLHFGIETECARRSDGIRVTRSNEFELQTLLSNQ